MGDPMQETTAATDGTEAVDLASGGLTGDTAIMTPDGPVQVTDLTVGTEVYALNPTTDLMKMKPVTTVDRTAEDEVVTIETRRADIHVASGQRIPFKTRDIARTRFQRAGDLEDRREYRFINEWRYPWGDSLETIDVTDFVDRYEARATIDCHGHSFRAALPDGCDPCRNNSHTGYFFDPETFKAFQPAIESVAEDVTIQRGPKHRGRPYRFDGDAFLRFLGWFVTEGSVTWSTARNSAEIQIAQEKPEAREAISDLLTAMGFQFEDTGRAFRFGSKLYGEFLDQFCTTDSGDKRLPALVWCCSPAQKQDLLDVLLRGDGNDRGTYYTASDALARDVLRLCIELGVKPRYRIRNGVWQIYVRRVNDGFDATRHVRRTAENRPLYRLAVEDYPVVMAGRNHKFQWVGVSGVS